MASRGRKRKLGPREPNGQLQRSHGPDRGTNELQARRVALIGSIHDQRAEHALGVLSANAYLNGPEYDALLAYQRLRWTAYGRPFAKVSTAERKGVADHVLDLPADASLADVIGRLREAPEERRRILCDTANAALLGAGRLAYAEVRNVAVFDRLPIWFHGPAGRRPSALTAHRFHAFKDGAQRLAKFFRTTAKVAR